jgi:hypothetical protein
MVQASFSYTCQQTFCFTGGWLTKLHPFGCSFLTAFIKRKTVQNGTFS